MRRPPVLATLLIALSMFGVATPAIAQDNGPLTLSVSTTQIDTRLGEKFAFQSTVTNEGSTPVSGVIAHLNIASLRPGTYVDPEDWSSDRTRYLTTVQPGQSLTTTWDMQAVNDGSFSVYVALLSEASARPGVGPSVRLDVASRRTLNPQGMVPIALGVPLLLVALMVVVRLRRRRSPGTRAPAGMSDS